MLAFAPGIVAATVILFFVGAASVRFMSVGNSTVQLAAPGPMRGRVMAGGFVPTLTAPPHVRGECRSVRPSAA